MPASSPNPGSGILLVLAIWGGIADWRYVRNGGKPPAQGTGRGLLAACALVLISLVYLGLRGASAEALGFLAGTFFVLTFVLYEGYRLVVRLSNPIPKYKV